MFQLQKNSNFDTIVPVFTADVAKKLRKVIRVTLIHQIFLEKTADYLKSESISYEKSPLQRASHVAQIFDQPRQCEWFINSRMEKRHTGKPMNGTRT